MSDGTSPAPVRNRTCTGGSTLVSVGVSTRGVLGPGQGPAVHPSDAEAFRRAKPSHRSVRRFLDGVRREQALLEAFVWSTCQRTEFYGWIRDTIGVAERADLMVRVRAALLGSEPPGLAVNVLAEDEARHHLLRTACGLNSDLPGDQDVAAQLCTALRSARSAGTAGPRCTRTVDEAVALANEVREHTRWGSFATGYCAAALARVCEVDGVDPVPLEHVIIGGSTTSRSVLGALRRDHEVDEERLSVAYRSHHGQRRELRAALGGGTPLKVRDYGDGRVLARIAEADVVYFGIDRPDPVLAASTLGALRDFGIRPLTVLDFNSSGSVGAGPLPRGISMWSARQLDEAVAAHTAILTARSDFLEALAEAEEHIACLVPAAAAVEGPC